MTQPDRLSLKMTSAQRAAAFFRQPVWSRLLESLYEKYIAQGRVGGQVILRSCTAEEQREISRFLNKRLPPNDTVVVRLSDFQQALNESGFPCELADLLAALYPERSQITRPEQRKLHFQTRQHFYDDLSSLANHLPTSAKGRRWLLSGAHGRDYLFRYHKNDAPTSKDMALQATRIVIDALDQLPTPPAYERLSLFAQRVSGDPHSLDAQSFAGRLFLYALEDLADLDYLQGRKPETNGGEESKHPLAASVFSSEEDTPLWREQNQQRLLLYYKVGLLTDTLSSTVAVFQLALAEDAQGLPDPLIEIAGSSVLTLNLRQLLPWQRLVPTKAYVYLFENPQVFESIIDELQQRADDKEDEQPRRLPTLICTSGWPSVATVRLLNLLVETTPHVILHYSGDFDLPGLRIAAYLQKYYRTQCRLWHLDPASYLTALHHKNGNFDSDELAALKTLPAQFAPLVAAMQEKGKKAYQEGITHLLLRDILAAESN